MVGLGTKISQKYVSCYTHITSYIQLMFLHMKAHILYDFCTRSTINMQNLSSISISVSQPRKWHWLNLSLSIVIICLNILFYVNIGHTRFSYSLRYEIMVSCWNIDPQERPTFSKLVKMFTELMEINAGGYLQLSQVLSCNNESTKSQQPQQPISTTVEEQMVASEVDVWHSQDLIHGSCA